MTSHDEDLKRDSFMKRVFRRDSYKADERALRCDERFLFGNRDFGMEVTILITNEGCQNMTKLFWDL